MSFDVLPGLQRIKIGDNPKAGLSFEHINKDFLGIFVIVDEKEGLLRKGRER